MCQKYLTQNLHNVQNSMQNIFGPQFTLKSKNVMLLIVILII